MLGFLVLGIFSIFVVQLKANAKSVPGRAAAPFLNVYLTTWVHLYLAPPFLSICATRLGA